MPCRGSAAAAVSKSSRTLPPERVLSPVEGLLQDIQILMVASLAHPLKRIEKLSMRGLRFGDYSGEIAKTPIFNKK